MSLHGSRLQIIQEFGGQVNKRIIQLLECFDEGIIPGNRIAGIGYAYFQIISSYRRQISCCNKIIGIGSAGNYRSEERRVGKECRSGQSTYKSKIKNQLT